MTAFELRAHDWFEGGAPKELAVTNTLLTIIVNDHIVSSLNTPSIRSVSDSLCLPLYPLAEWLAGNWWRLLYECNALRQPQEYQERHNLMFAGEGYLLPDLTLLPEQDVFRLQWHPRSINQGARALTSQGNATLDFPLVMETLAAFIRLVVDRLAVCGLHDTPLQQDWQAICASSQDPEERSFCIACAQLGLDPYCVDTETANRIIQADETLSGSLDMADLFHAASPEELLAFGSWLQEQQHTPASSCRAAQRLRDIRASLPPTSPNRPWTQGYEDARWLRANFCPSQSALRTLRGLVDDLTRHTAIPCEFCNALVHHHQTPAFLTSAPAKSFLQGRLLGEFLRHSDHQLNLVTRVNANSQKYTRAFAAELVAPASELQRSLKGRTVLGEEDIADLAEQFDTSEFVIRHQMENHHLASIA